MTGKVFGQPGNVPLSDTICVKIITYQKLVIAAEQKKVLQEQLLVIDKRIIEKDSIIRLLQFKEELNGQMIQTYEDELLVIKDQRKIFETAIKQNEKIIRKLKRKVFWTSMAGIAAVGATVFLTLK